MPQKGFMAHFRYSYRSLKSTRSLGVPQIRKGKIRASFSTGGRTNCFCSLRMASNACVVVSIKPPPSGG